MDKLRNDKWHKATAAEVIKATEEIERYIEKYGWQERTVAPYGWSIKVTELIKPYKDYDLCSYSSKALILSELNGLIHIINGWLEYEAEPKVTIRRLSGRNAGKVVEVAKTLAEDLIEIGLAEAV